MQHGMAVRAHRNEIIPGINLVLADFARHSQNVMDVDEVATNLAVPILKIHGADRACVSVSAHTGIAGTLPSLAEVTGDLVASALYKLLFHDRCGR